MKQFISFFNMSKLEAKRIRTSWGMERFLKMYQERELPQKQTIAFIPARKDQTEFLTEVSQLVVGGNNLTSYSNASLLASYLGADLIILFGHSQYLERIKPILGDYVYDIVAPLEYKLFYKEQNQNHKRYIMVKENKKDEVGFRFDTKEVLNLKNIPIGYIQTDYITKGMFGEFMEAFKIVKVIYKNLLGANEGMDYLFVDPMRLIPTTYLLHEQFLLTTSYFRYIRYFQNKLACFENNDKTFLEPVLPFVFDEKIVHKLIKSYSRIKNTQMFFDIIKKEYDKREVVSFNTYYSFDLNKWEEYENYMEMQIASKFKKNDYLKLYNYLPFKEDVFNFQKKLKKLERNNIIKKNLVKDFYKNKDLDILKR